MRLSCCLLACVGLTYLAAQTVLSQPVAGDASIKQVLDVYRQRDNQMNPIHVRYRIIEQYHPAWLSTKSISQRDGWLPTRTLEAEYARKGNKILSYAKQVAPEASNDWEREQFWLRGDDASIRKSNKKGEYLITKRPDEMFAARPPTSVTLEREMLSSLRQWEAGTNPIAATAVERMEDGKRILFAELRYKKTGWSNKLRLLADRDYAIDRYDVVNAKGGPVDSVTVDAVGTFQGLAYPTKAILKHYMGDGSPAYTIDLAVGSVELDPAKIPDTLFQFTFPPGSQIYDEYTKSYVRHTELTESHLGEIARNLAHRSPIWGRWWFIVTLIGVLAALLAVFRCYLVRRRAKQ
jgi:hypothetical protein